jgi:hypothetical protein
MDDVFACSKGVQFCLGVITEEEFNGRDATGEVGGTVSSDGHVVQDLHGAVPPPPKPNDQEEYDAWPDIYPGQ